MTAPDSHKSLLRRLGDVFRGADTVFGEPDARPTADASPADLAARDDRIAALEASCRDLQAASAAATQSARDSATLSLLEAVAGPLSQLATLRSLAARGTVPEVGDVLRLTESLQQAFAEAGLEPIGEAGQDALFDPTLHRPVGRDVFREGEEVSIAFVGFRLGQRIVRPALVARKEN